MKKVAIMQPYFLPYIGYWQLISSVDEFVVYDNIQYTKKGWFNRNRILENGHDRLFTVPIKKGSDFLNVDERFLSDDVTKENNRTLRVIQTNYRGGPHYGEAYPLLEQCFLSTENNLFEYIYHSIKLINAYLGIHTKITISSHMPIDHNLKADKKVLAICKELGADMYVNAIGGMELYSKEEFAESGIELRFIKSKAIEYKQFDEAFVPWLSIIDLLMFNDRATLEQMLEAYELI